VDNIKMDLGQIGWGGVDWIGLAQDRDKWRVLVNAVMNLRVPYNSGKLSSSLSSRPSAQLRAETALSITDDSWSDPYCGA
jgi:hypothetical protein